MPAKYRTQNNCHDQADSFSQCFVLVSSVVSSVISSALVAQQLVLPDFPAYIISNLTK